MKTSHIKVRMKVGYCFILNRSGKSISYEFSETENYVNPSNVQKDLLILDDSVNVDILQKTNIIQSESVQCVPVISPYLIIFYLNDEKLRRFIKMKHLRIFIIKLDKIGVTKDYYEEDEIKLDLINEDEVQWFYSQDSVSTKTNNLIDYFMYEISIFAIPFVDSEIITELVNVRGGIKGMTADRNMVYIIRNNEKYIMAYDLILKKEKCYDVGVKFNQPSAMAISRSEDIIYVSHRHCNILSVDRFVKTINTYKSKGCLVSQEEYLRSFGIIVTDKNEVVIIYESKNKSMIEKSNIDGSIKNAICINSKARYITEIHGGLYDGMYAVTHIEPAKCICIYEPLTGEMKCKIVHDDMIHAPRGIVWIKKYQSLFVVDFALEHVVQIQLLENKTYNIRSIALGVKIDKPFHICCDSTEQYLIVGQNCRRGKVFMCKMMKGFTI